MLVTLFEGEPIDGGAAAGGRAARAGLRVEVYPEPDKLGKQFKYAQRRGDARSSPSSAPTSARAAR